MSQNDPTPPITFEINNDSDIKRFVRGITGYDPTPSELPQEDLETQIALAKGRLSMEYSLSGQPWFSDQGLGIALVYGCAIYCKLTVENHSVASWDFGDEEIESRSLSPEESAQLSIWIDIVKDGTDNSDDPSVGGKGSVGPSLTFNPNW